MTIEEIEAIPAEVVPVDVVAKYLGCSPQLLRMTARKNKDALGFSTICVGSRVLIPKAAFVRYVKGV